MKELHAEAKKLQVDEMTRTPEQAASLFLMNLEDYLPGQLGSGFYKELEDIIKAQRQAAGQEEREQIIQAIKNMECNTSSEEGICNVLDMLQGGCLDVRI